MDDTIGAVTQALKSGGGGSSSSSAATGSGFRDASSSVSCSLFQALPPRVRECCADARHVRSGIFPEIQRAWAILDNRLLLWKYSTVASSAGVSGAPSAPRVTEYKEPRQAILAVGLLKPKPGVFHVAYSYVLVLTTPASITLCGLCFPKDNGDGKSTTSSQAGEDLEIHFMPQYTLSSSEVRMLCVATSNRYGRIFLGGENGHVYELYYDERGAGDIIRSANMRLYCATGGLAAYLASFFIFGGGWGGKPPRISQIVVDDYRKVVYALSHMRQILVLEMTGSLRKCAEASVTGQVLKMTPLAASSLSAADLAVITSDLQTQLWTLQMSRDKDSQKVVGIASKGIISVAGAAKGNGPVLMSGMITAAFIPPGSLRFQVSARQLLGSTLTESVPAVVQAIAEVPPPDSAVAAIEPPLGTPQSSSKASCVLARPETETQHILPPRKFIVLCADGIRVYSKVRAIDDLVRILSQYRDSGSSGVAPAQLRDYYMEYGDIEVSAMLLAIAIGLPEQKYSVYKQEALTFFLERHIFRAENASEGTFPSTASVQYFSQSAAGHLVTSSVSEAYSGAMLLLARLLRPIWEAKPISAGDKKSNSAVQYKCCFDAKQLDGIVVRVRKLESVLAELETMASRPEKGEATMLKQLREVAGKAADAAFVIKCVGLCHAQKVLDTAGSSCAKFLTEQPFRSLLNSEARSNVTELVSAVLKAAESDATVGGTKGMAQELAQHARSFFSADEAAAAAATSQLRSALSSQASDRVRSSTMASEAAMQLFKVVDKGKTVPAVAQQVTAAIPLLMKLSQYRSAIDLALRLQKPDLLAGELDPSRLSPPEMTKFLTQAFETMVSHFRSGGGGASGSKSAVSSAAASAIFDKMMSLGLESELLKLDSTAAAPFIEAYLGEKLEKGAEYIELLSKLYTKRGQYGKGALLLQALAFNKEGGIGESYGLRQRREYLERAIYIAKMDPIEAETVDTFQSYKFNADIQFRILEKLEKGDTQAMGASVPAAELEAIKRDLAQNIVTDLSRLLSWTQRLCMWKEYLEVLYQADGLENGNGDGGFGPGHASSSMNKVQTAWAALIDSVPNALTAIDAAADIITTTWPRRKACLGFVLVQLCCKAHKGDAAASSSENVEAAFEHKCIATLLDALRDPEALHFALSDLLEHRAQITAAMALSSLSSTLSSTTVEVITGQLLQLVAQLLHVWLDDYIGYRQKILSPSLKSPTSRASGGGTARGSILRIKELADKYSIMAQTGLGGEGIDERFATLKQQIEQRI